MASPTTNALSVLRCGMSESGSHVIMQYVLPASQPSQSANEPRRSAWAARLTIGPLAGCAGESGRECCGMWW